MENINQYTFREKALEENTVIIDVRTPEEWGNGVIENTILLDIMDTDHFFKTIQELDKSKEYLVYCRSGARSGQACQVMDSLGFKATNNLAGGILEWDAELLKK